MSLTEFLLARIAEDENVAIRAAHQKVGGPSHGDWHPDSAFLSSGSPLERVDRLHIARWDPARVLAECEAKRRILANHSNGGESQGYDNSGYGYIGDCCNACGTHGEYGEPWPCGTVRALAAVYADHPDYRQEWAL